MRRDIVKIEMTEEQQNWLLQRMREDWNQEIEYQDTNQELDLEYLEALKECFIACLGKPRFALEAMANEEIAKGLEEDLEDLKERNRLYKEELENEKKNS